jgi:hypothetical protein
MDRAEAFKTLHLDDTADGQMVQAAYWTLVRQAQERGKSDPGARAQIDRYNEACSLLSPGSRLYTAPEPQQAGAPPAGTEFVDRAVDWLSEEATRTRLRWPGRNAEILIICVATLFLMIVAISGGANFLLTMLGVVAVFVAVWAPWHRERAPKADDATAAHAGGPAHDLGE